MGVVARAYSFSTSAVGVGSSKVILSFIASLRAVWVSETLSKTKQVPYEHEDVTVLPRILLVIYRGWGGGIYL